MSGASNFDVELAEGRVLQERDRGLARIAHQLGGEGADDCIACGEPIPAKRRQAMPSAQRCAGCQEKAERRGRQYARG
ncbi:TraR/DksA C4-type zinc finger protein [Roseibium sp.]|uniref:TraR/DksA C4-type zinc finger protein n=1 Tax=Roseibium sp. TaxID=1936156 RepID=UPI0032654B43